MVGIDSDDLLQRFDDEVGAQYFQTIGTEKIVNPALAGEYNAYKGIRQSMENEALAELSNTGNVTVSLSTAQRMKRWAEDYAWGNGREVRVNRDGAARIALRREQGVVEVDAGVLGIDLEQHLERQGLTVGHFPSSILCSTIGGWVAARGAGQCSSRYGKIEDMLSSADCVLGSGDRVTFTRRVGGPNPLGLMIGSEGTLGLITRARLRLHPAPVERVFAGYRLASFDAGAEAMRTLMQSGLRPAVLRLYDPIDSYLLSRGKVTDEPGTSPRKSGMPSGFWLRAALGSPRSLNGAIAGFERLFSASVTLIVVFEGETKQAQDDAQRAKRLLREVSAESLGEGPARAWFAHRYAVSYRQSKVFQQGAFNETLEVAAPWSRLMDVYDAVRRAAGAYALVLAHLSHAYPDGCSIYFTLVATRQGAPLERYDALIDAALGAALLAGATLSHHHGVGRSKSNWLDLELGGGLAVLRRLRRAWDPQGLLNPAALEPTADLKFAPQRQPVPGIDAVSGIGTFPGKTPLHEVESEARARGLSLGLADPLPPFTVAAWLAAGLPGVPDPTADPVLGHVCGIAALGAGVRFQLLPAPRRAVGPDLTMLCVGASHVIATATSASLSLVKATRPKPESSPLAPLGSSEAEAWQRVLNVFSDREGG